MLGTMTPAINRWALLVVLTLGLWAGGAAAQSDDGGGWFEGGPDTSERPQLKLHGKGPLDPPPPDFRSEPAPPSAPGPETIREEESAADEVLDDAASHERAVREFSPHLAPYGHWVDDPYYGRVWVPSRGVVGARFRPYVSGGRWELTADDEWLWVSDYPFGWVTFHYGRWAWLSGGVGWGWVPGYVYSPAWVDFRIGSSGYVGWGPAPPYSVWRSGVFVSLGVRRPVPYIFCPTSYVFSRSLPRYIVSDRHRVRSIAASTHRYRPRYVRGAYRVRSPSVREARIPSRYVPTRRVIAEPRGSSAGSQYRERRRSESRRYSSPTRLSSPREARYRTTPIHRDRSINVRSRSRPARAVNVAPSQRVRRSSGAAAASHGTSRQGWSAASRARPSDARHRSDARRSERRSGAAHVPRRAAPPPSRWRDEGSRSRSTRSRAVPERRRSSDSDRRASGRSRGRDSSQQRSRRARGDRDRR